MSFRYDIGFLRAFAVLVVVFFHYQIPFFEGGFVGVDIFFVISGYLMTRIILSKFQSNSFNLWDFYKRRFVRIVPALIIMMIGVLIGAFFLYFPLDLKQASLNALFSTFFLSNYYYLFNSGYFDPSSQFNLFLHTWSLSVEWQFYMIYPIFLILIKKIYLRSYKNFKIIFLIVTILSFSLVIIFNNYFPSSYSKISFFSFTHRAWEMMLGGLAFLYSDFFQNKIPDFSKKIISYVCFIGLIVSVFYFKEDDLWPSSLTILPTMASFLLIALSREYSFYKSKSLQYISSISYSLYLWHWPVYVIGKYYDYKGWGFTICMLMLSVFLSILSYEFLEKKTKTIPTKAILIVTIFTLVFTISLSFLSLNSFLFDKEVIALTEFKAHYEPTRLKQFNTGVCHNASNINYKDCLNLDLTRKNILLMGDSHGGHYSLSFRNKIDKNKYNFLEHTVVGSFPLINSQGTKLSTDQFKDLYKNFIVPNKDNIDIIIISCHWLKYKKSAGFHSNIELAKGINETIKFIENMGIKVIILGQTEKYNIPFLRTKAFDIEGNNGDAYVNEKSYLLNNTLKELIPKKNYVDLFLNTKFSHFDVINKMPYIFDHNHLTVYGADQVVEYLITNNIIY
ncbi:MAG: acyltransferase family protein [Polaribacter sp.]|uniref:acyltransferase family protein n=1 Tax=Polaribacter sp. TaxID=1920175 RepID=UPI003EF93F02